MTQYTFCPRFSRDDNPGRLRPGPNILGNRDAAIRYLREHPDAVEASVYRDGRYTGQVNRATGEVAFHPVLR